VDVFTRSENEHIPAVSHDLGYFNRVVHIPAGPQVFLPKEELTEYTKDFAQGILDFAEKKQIHYDLIHSHYWLSGIAGELLKNQWDVPMLQMFHTLGKIKQRIGRTAEEREGKYRIKGESHVIEVADLIIAATEDEQDQLFDLYQVPSEKVKIIPPGVNIHHFYPIPTDEAKEAIGLSPRDKAALFVGRIEPLKGVDTLLQAMAILKRNCRLFICPDYLIIIGGDPGGEEEKLSYEMTRLQSLSHELDLEDMVIFLGKRGQDTLPYYYSAAEVVVVPSHYESFGMVALEAMACGTPVIASRVGGLAHLVKDGETGFNVPAQDPDALAEKLRALFVDHDLRAAFGARAAAYARGFSWEIITKQMTEVYRELVVKTL
jgi:D-inositol-3-phosphate glycosyltransferase